MDNKKRISIIFAGDHKLGKLIEVLTSKSFELESFTYGNPEDLIWNEEDLFRELKTNHYDLCFIMLGNQRRQEGKDIRGLVCQTIKYITSLSHTCVIGLTTEEDPRWYDEPVQAGARKVLCMPVPIEEIIQTVKEVLA